MSIHAGRHCFGKTLQKNTLVCSPFHQKRFKANNQEPEKECEKERLQDNKQPFSEFGISDEPANVLASFNFPNTSNFYKTISKQKFVIKLPKRFYEMPKKVCYDGRDSSQKTRQHR